jgi:hypothetical protein
MSGEIRSSPKKARKPQARSLPLREAILAVAAEYERMSLRQLYYQLVSRGLPKTERAYKRVGDAATQLRLDHSLDYRKIVDGARTRRSIQQYDNMHAAMENAHAMYRRNFWLNQPRTVEVWCEKDALSGVIMPVCARWGVTYVATRGFPSVTLRYESAMELLAQGKPATVFYFGDHDASGRAISANLEGELRQHGADVTVVRMALEPAQIAAYRLPTRPGKLTDSRQAQFAAAYGGASVELDALPPSTLTRLVERAIQGEIDAELWDAEMAVERLERETLASIVSIPWQPGQVYNLTPEKEAS